VVREVGVVEEGKFRGLLNAAPHMAKPPLGSFLTQFFRDVAHSRSQSTITACSGEVWMWMKRFIVQLTAPIGGVRYQRQRGPMMMSQGLAARDLPLKDRYPGNCSEYFLLSPVFFVLL
jgi:hypothetical protein